MTYVRLSTGNRWRRQQLTDNAVPSFAIKLKHLIVNKMMAHVTGQVGILRKSLDSGVTWTDAAMLSGCDSCLDVCEDADGGVWGLFLVDASTTAKVGYSDDAMLTWTLKYTHTAGHQAFNIAVSPERAAEYKVAFTARDDTGVDMSTLGDHFEVVRSNNSGTTWVTKEVAYRLTEDVDNPLIQYLPGKLQVLFRGRQITFENMGFDAITTQDIRFVDAWGNGGADPGLGGMGELDPDTDRAIVVLASASADPTFTVSGASSTLLAAFESDTPANFGGDGHEWWRLYLVTPTADLIDFTGTTGAFRNCSFFRASAAGLSSIAHTFTHDLQYHGSQVGTAIEIANAGQGTELGDVLWNWIDHRERTIDDLYFDKLFNDGGSFNHDYSRHNSAFIPLTPGGGAASSIDWYQDTGGDELTSHSVTAQLTGTAIADPCIFPNSVRILVIEATARLRALRDSTEDGDPSTFVLASVDDGDTWDEEYANVDFPLPVELIRYRDTSPSFAAVADPNKVIRSTGGEWEEFDDPLTVAGLTADIASLAYDLVSDRLFVWYINNPKIFALQDASIADSAQANAAAAAAGAELLEDGVEGYWQLIPSVSENPVSYRSLVVHKKERAP